MGRLTAQGHETRSVDLIAGNIDQFKVLFPAVFTGGKDFVYPDDFCDSAFSDDVAKTNLTAILQRYGLDNAWSL